MDSLLSMVDVTKVYGSGEAAVRALDGVNITADAGQVTVVMGPSGGGKTTFLTIAGALLKATSGTVSVAGTDITNLTEKDLPKVRREKIGFVFQNFNLLETLKAIDNVALVMTEEKSARRRRNRARELLAMLGLGHRLNNLPKNLSGGEKQRVAIARALANNPDLILADEPTANLDSSRGREVMKLLRQVSHEMGKAVVIVSHDLWVREVADKIYWLQDGHSRDVTEEQRAEGVAGASPP